jgi:predicted ArsR family transcriptional regulator
MVYARREPLEPDVTDFDSQEATIAALGEPIRRALYQFVARQAVPVGREQAANAVGVPWHVAKFHLDRLERDGLLDVEFRRPPGRGGPGAGRPTKLYRRSSRELSISLPERRYDLAGRIMASAITATQSGSASLVDGLREAALATGRSIGDEARQRAGANPERLALLAAASEVLDDYGYESRVEECITLANCPFHALAQEYTELVCGMNLDLLRGMLDSLGAAGIEARLDPAPGRCCVTVCAP